MCTPSYVCIWGKRCQTMHTVLFLSFLRFSNPSSFSSSSSSSSWLPPRLPHFPCSSYIVILFLVILLFLTVAILYLTIALFLTTPYTSWLYPLHFPTIILSYLTIVLFLIVHSSSRVPHYRPLRPGYRPVLFLNIVLFFLFLFGNQYSLITTALQYTNKRGKELKMKPVADSFLSSSSSQTLALADCRHSLPVLSHFFLTATMAACLPAHSLPMHVMSLESANKK